MEQTKRATSQPSVITGRLSLGFFIGGSRRLRSISNHLRRRAAESRSRVRQAPLAEQGMA